MQLTATALGALTLGALIGLFDDADLPCLGSEHFDNEVIDEAMYRSHLVAAQITEGYIVGMKALASNPLMEAMHDGAVRTGPDAVRAIISIAVSSGFLSKENVKQAAGIKTQATKKKDRTITPIEAVIEMWLPNVFAEANRLIYTSFADSLDQLREQYGLDDEIENFEDFLKCCNQSSLGCAVDDTDAWQHSTTDDLMKNAAGEPRRFARQCSLSLLYRLDFNTPSRNATAYRNNARLKDGLLEVNEDGSYKEKQRKMKKCPEIGSGMAKYGLSATGEPLPPAESDTEPTEAAEDPAEAPGAAATAEAPGAAENAENDIEYDDTLDYEEGNKSEE